MLGALQQSAPLLAQLHTLVLANNTLPGNLDALPAAFSSSFPALQALDLSGVGIQGSLPAGTLPAAAACLYLSIDICHFCALHALLSLQRLKPPDDNTSVPLQYAALLMLISLSGNMAVICAEH